MLKEIGFINWKSFSEANLYIDPLTVLIGTNASGKSNALDGISFLSRIAEGKDLKTALAGDPSLKLDSKNAIRGGVEWAAKKPDNHFELNALIQYDENIDYWYAIEVRTAPQVELISERLIRIEKDERKKEASKDTVLLNAHTEHTESPTVAGDLYNGKGRPKKKQFKRSVSIISQLKNQELRKEILEGVQLVSNVLENIFILDPVPTRMRDYSPLSDQLASNASNLAGVLAALPGEEKQRVENLLSQYISKLPEGDICRIWAETVGLFNSDAMLYCEENWVEGKETFKVDARSMSDGTLRLLAIITALLTRPEGTMVVIEEIDNGLHPSRAHLLLKMLQEIGQKRKIDILMTTHNPALIDELGSEMIPFIVVAHRSKESGESQLTLLEDVKNLPKLLASGTLGKLVTKGVIEDSLSDVGGIKNAE